MDYYQGVVEDYLRADRSLFVNSEFFLQIQPGSQPPKGSSWYCDILAADFKNKTVFLCEVTYSTTLQALLKRLKAWNEHWKEVNRALVQDSKLPAEWPVRPWLFVPENCVKVLCAGLEKIRVCQPLEFKPMVTTLEMVQPWEYCSWNRVGEKRKPDSIPQDMQI